MEVPIIELIEIGKRAFNEDDFDRAEECIGTVLQHGQRFADLLNIMGIIYHDRGDFNRAIDSFKEALVINPQYVEPRLNLAVLYNDLGDYAAARKLLTHKGVKGSQTKFKDDPILDGKLANQHAMMGDMYRRLGRFDEAITEYRKALSLGSGFADIRTRLGTALREAGNTKEALKELRRACKDKPNFLEARIQLGVTLFATGRHSDARKEWEAVLKKDKDDPKARMYLLMVQNGKTPTKPRKAAPKRKPTKKPKK